MRLFSDEEFKERLKKVLSAIETQGLDAVIITNPENIYYLSGLNHQGYFSYSALIISHRADPILILRGMEKMIVQDMVVPWVQFFPYADGVPPSEQTEALALDNNIVAPLGTESSPATVTVNALKEMGLEKGRVAFEQSSAFLPYEIAAGFISQCPNVTFSDAGHLINDCRSELSASEIALTEKAAKISDAMMLSAIACAREGVTSTEVARHVYSAMISKDSTFPAFVPLIRSYKTLHHEHGTWDDEVLEHGEPLFLEMSGCTGRYHAPVGRFIHIGQASPGADFANKACIEAEQKVIETIKPGITAGEVYDAWKSTIDRFGFEHYHRHHCGYMVGIGFPPSWSGCGVPRSLRKGSDMVLKKGNVFHLLSWLMNSGKGDAFVSDTVVVTENGARRLTQAMNELTVC